MVIKLHEGLSVDSVFRFEFGPGVEEDREIQKKLAKHFVGYKGSGFYYIVLEIFGATAVVLPFKMGVISVEKDEPVEPKPKDKVALTFVPEGKFGVRSRPGSIIGGPECSNCGNRHLHISDICPE